MKLQRPHSGDDNHGCRAQAAFAAFDMQELLRAQIRSEACLGHDKLAQLQGHPGGGKAVAAMGDIGERSSMDQRRGILQRLHQIGLHRFLQQHRHGALGLQVPHIYGLSRIGIADEHPGEGLLQLAQSLSQAEDRHNF
ncbi:hypothetical protein D3C76_1392840 [compost metagenome]